MNARSDAELAALRTTIASRDSLAASSLRDNVRRELERMVGWAGGGNGGGSGGGGGNGGRKGSRQPHERSGPEEHPQWHGVASVLGETASASPAQPHVKHVLRGPATLLSPSTTRSRTFEPTLPAGSGTRRAAATLPAEFATRRRAEKACRTDVAPVGAPALATAASGGYPAGDSSLQIPPSNPAVAVHWDEAAATSSASSSASLLEKEEEELKEELALSEEVLAMLTVALHELIRQVSVGCIERAQLMGLVWVGYTELFARQRSLLTLLRRRAADWVARCKSADADVSRLEAALAASARSHGSGRDGAALPTQVSEATLEEEDALTSSHAGKASVSQQSEQGIEQQEKQQGEQGSEQRRERQLPFLPFFDAISAKPPALHLSPSFHSASAALHSALHGVRHGYTNSQTQTDAAELRALFLLVLAADTGDVGAGEGFGEGVGSDRLSSARTVLTSGRSSRTQTEALAVSDTIVQTVADTRTLRECARLAEKRRALLATGGREGGEVAGAEREAEAAHAAAKLSELVDAVRAPAATIRVPGRVPMRLSADALPLEVLPPFVPKQFRKYALALKGALAAFQLEPVLLSFADLRAQIGALYAFVVVRALPPCSAFLPHAPPLAQHAKAGREGGKAGATAGDVSAGAGSAGRQAAADGGDGAGGMWVALLAEERGERGDLGPGGRGRWAGAARVAQMFLFVEAACAGCMSSLLWQFVLHTSPVPRVAVRALLSLFSAHSHVSSGLAADAILALGRGAGGRAGRLDERVKAFASLCGLYEGGADRHALALVCKLLACLFPCASIRHRLTAADAAGMPLGWVGVDEASCEALAVQLGVDAERARRAHFNAGAAAEGTAKEHALLTSVRLLGLADADAEALAAGATGEQAAVRKLPVDVTIALLLRTHEETHGRRSSAYAQAFAQATRFTNSHLLDAKQFCALVNSLNLKLDERAAVDMYAEALSQSELMLGVDIEFDLTSLARARSMPAGSVTDLGWLVVVHRHTLAPDAERLAAPAPSALASPLKPRAELPSHLALPQLLRERAAATAPPEGGAVWLATMMLLFATMLLLLSRAVTGAVSRSGEQHAETPLKATKATTTMLLPAATAVCALAAARCCPLETPLKATKATTTMLLPTAAAGTAARGGGPHTETPLKATKATKTMLLPAAATAGLRRPRRGRGGASGPGRTHSHPSV
ncbi:hypothetical protein T492DRAFT_907414 [Pavlovales sp. CCMP2436]|nr:hypothetical protein T492DRAFT_907414 [Pavlovales sp. CCMP2436]